MVYRLGELFCGPGGIGLGATLSHVSSSHGDYRIQHTWANDYDASACETFQKNLLPHDPHRILCAPVELLDFSMLPEVDAVTFGFPCNDFSMVGEHKGLGGNFGGLYKFGVTALRHFRPQWFVAENVSGLQSANHGQAFTQILRELALEGYNLVAHEYKFEQYGIPQKRHRIIVVGLRKDIPHIFRVPAPITPRKYVTASEALQGVEQVPYNNEATNHAPQVIEMLQHIRPGENAWSESVPERLRLNVKGARLSQIYRRLDPNQPSYTVTGSGGGGTHVYHWDEPRALTNRERARLQSFPDDYVFYGSKEQVRRQIGMAVPPMAAKVIFEAILKTLAGVQYPHTDANITINHGHTLTFEFAQ